MDKNLPHLFRRLDWLNESLPIQTKKVAEAIMMLFSDHTTVENEHFIFII